ncbi:hypothetical protein ABZP36_017997 [Zizania latifolia]
MVLKNAALQQQRNGRVMYPFLQSKLPIPRADIYPTPRRSDNDAERCCLPLCPPPASELQKSRLRTPSPPLFFPARIQLKQPTGFVVSAKRKYTSRDRLAGRRTKQLVYILASAGCCV